MGQLGKGRTRWAEDGRRRGYNGEGTPNEQKPLNQGKGEPKKRMDSGAMNAEKRRMGDNIVDSLEELLEQNKDLFHSSHHLITKTKLVLSQSYGNTKGHMQEDMNKKQMARKIQVTI